MLGHDVRQIYVRSKVLDQHDFELVNVAGVCTRNPGAAQFKDRSFDADAIAKKIRRAKTDPDALPSEVKGLEGRAEDSAEVINERMANAEHEMLRADEYEYQVINDDLDATFQRLRNIIDKESEANE